MEAKKTEKANLENKRFIFQEIGLIAALAILLCAFESRHYQEDTKEIIIPATPEETYEVLPIFVPQRAAKPLPKVTQLPLIDLMEVVDELDINEENIELNDAIVSAIEGSADGSEIWTEKGFGDEERGEEDVFVVVEKSPQFNGNLNEWLSRHLKYPAIARENNIQGKVYVTFIVEKDGSISNVEILRSADPILDAEALRVVKSMPKWEPGKQRNMTVRVKFTLPIMFRLQ